MATIRKRLGKWQVQIRRKNYPNIIKTFTEKSSADKYVREIEVLMDREQFQDLSAAANTTLGDILKRYVNEITPVKKGAQWEQYKINWLIRHKISLKTLTQLNSKDLYELKNELSTTRKPGTVRQYFHFINPSCLFVFLQLDRQTVKTEYIKFSASQRGGKITLNYGGSLPKLA